MFLSRKNKGELNLRKTNKSPVAITNIVAMCMVFLIFIGVLVFLLVDTIGFAPNAERVNGEISYVINDEGEQNIFVNFDYNGTTYKEIELDKNAGWNFYEGKEVTLYVNSEDVSDVRVSKFRWNVVPFLILFLAVGIFPILIILFNTSFNVDKKRKKFMNNGKKIMAMVDEAVITSRIVSYGKRASCLKCSYKDSLTGKEYIFKSHKVWDNGSLNALVGDYIAVYVMPSNYSKYYVDIEGAYSYQNTYRYKSIK